VQKHITPRRLWQLFDLFRSADPRERDYLKTIIHRIYGKCLILRATIRQNTVKFLMSNTYSDMIVHETDYKTDDPSQSPYGFAECLEILNAIIGGFMLPLDQDHRTHIFEHCLVPLHRS
jgi:serine/threonine-protein phosphatase 2A regulatory subunit B'